MRRILATKRTALGFGLTSAATACSIGLFAVAACSSGGASEQVDRGLRNGAFEPIEGMEATTDQQPISPEDATTIYRAQDRLVAACMAEAGFEYDAVSIADSPLPPPLYLSPTELRRSGYEYDWAQAAERFLELNGPDGPPDPTAGMSPEEVDAYSAALGGSTPDATVTLEDSGGGTTSFPTEGCEAEARTELFGSVANFIRFDRANQTLSHSGLSRKLTEYDEHRVPLAGWQECMQSAGYDVGDNDYGAYYIQDRGAAALGREGTQQSSVTADFITGVVDADADCQESSGIYEVRRELLPDARDEIAADLGFEMNQYIAFQHAVLERAERVP